MIKTIEETLDKEGVLWQTTVGSSMEPMLRERESAVEIVKAEGKLKRYDLPLYKRQDGSYVLHRIHKVKKDCYIICGDNRTERERVLAEQILGVTRGYTKNGRYISVKSFKYRIYVHLWCDFFYVRVVFRYVKNKFFGLIRKLKRSKKR